MGHCGRPGPPYVPEDELCRGIGGEVQVLLTYDKLGRVVDVAIQRSSGNRNLDRAAINAARDWRVNPGLRNGFPEAGRVIVPVNFQADAKNGPACTSAVRIEGLRFGRKTVEAGQDRIQYTRTLAGADTALLQVSYVAAKDKPAETISVDWYRDGEPGALDAQRQSLGLAGLVDMIVELPQQVEGSIQARLA